MLYTNTFRGGFRGGVLSLQIRTDFRIFTPTLYPKMSWETRPIRGGEVGLLGLRASATTWILKNAIIICKKRKISPNYIHELQLDFFSFLLGVLYTSS